MAKPKITVLMAVYNGEKHLATAIESILCQTYKDFEFIIIDDFSTDNSLDIIQSHAKTDSRIKVFENLVNCGLTKSLNKGLQCAQGKYIARMDADDISVPIRLMKQYNLLSLNYGAYSVVGCNFDIINADRPLKIIKRVNLAKYNDDIRRGLAKESVLCHPSVMFNKDDIRAVGGYDESFRYAQDYDLWIRLWSKGYNIYNCEGTTLYALRRGGDEIASTKRNQVIWAGIRVKLKHIHLFWKMPVYWISLLEQVARFLPRGIRKCFK